MSDTAAQRRSEILAAARGEAEAILEEARRQANARHETAVAELRRDLSAQAHRERAELAAKYGDVILQGTVVDEVLEQASRELLRYAERAPFGDVIEVLLSEALRDAPEKYIVEVSPRHGQHCEQWLRDHGRPHVAVTPQPRLEDGVIIEDRQRSFRVTNTLSSRFTRVRREARRRCLARLFGGQNL